VDIFDGIDQSDFMTPQFRDTNPSGNNRPPFSAPEIGERLLLFRSDGLFRVAVLQFSVLTMQLSFLAPKRAS